jgi:hypothetical protein
MDRHGVQQLSASRLLGDLGRKGRVAQAVVRSLYQAGRQVGPEGIGPWRESFEKTCGAGMDRALEAARHVVGGYEIPPDGLHPEALLCALHTYYALVVKLLAGQAIGRHYGLPSPAKRLVRTGGGAPLCEQIARFERGEFWHEVGLGETLADNVHAWYAGAGSAELAESLLRLAATVAAHQVSTSPSPGAGTDLFKPLYLDLFPRRLRHGLGEYYTPDWLVEHVLDRVGYSGEPGRRLLDPACGSGSFLLAAIARIRGRATGNGEVEGADAGRLCQTILSNVAGLEKSPLATLAARAGVLIAVADLLPHAGPVTVPVLRRDAILDEADAGQPGPVALGGFDCIVGNPPWVAWDNMPDDYRRATRPLWQRYGLFSLSANAGRHGGAKKDLAMLLLYSAADRYLADGGQLAMVLSQTLLQTGQAGDGFRRFRLGPEGTPLEVRRVDDMVALRPFADAATRTGVILLRKGEPTRYPVPYTVWKPGGLTEECLAEPIDPARPGSPWFVRPPGLTTPIERLFGPSDYVARLGANSGGANGLYWLEVLRSTPEGLRVRNLAGEGKRNVEPVECVVEPELIYPLLRWGDVGRYRATPGAHVLLPQDLARRTGLDPETMARRYPRTLSYLSRFETLLTGRAAYRRYQGGRPFWSMYNVGTYTVAPYKVVWRRMDRRLTAAVVEELDDPLLGRRSPVPQETCVLVAVDGTDEAHYLCALLNSAIVDFLVRAHSVHGGKGFGTPGMLSRLNLRRFRPDDPIHAELSACSRRAHAAAAAGEDVADVQRRMDDLARMIHECL